MPQGEFDAIVVPGGGLTADGNLANRNYDRLNKAIQLYHQGAAPNLILSGGSPLLDKEAAITSEAELMESYAISQAVPAEAILTERRSRDTIGNAVYTKKNILLPKGWDNLLIVTSASHAARCQKIFEHVLGKDYMVDIHAVQESLARVKRAGTLWGVLTMHHVLNGTAPGDHETIGQKLKDRIPGYGGTSTLLQLRMNSVLDFLFHPLSAP